MAAHRYWRLLVRANNGGTCATICEVEMFTSIGGVNQCVGGNPIYSTFQVSWEPAKAFDGIKNADQGWASATNDIDGAWIGYDFGAGNEKDIAQIAVTSRINASGLLQTPRVFQLQWSDDATTWYQKGSIDQQTGWTANETRTFTTNEITTNLCYAVESQRQVFQPAIRVASFKKSTTGGDGSLGGTVLESSAPVQGAIITVFDETTHAVAGQGTTNILGDWVVDNINPNKTYFAVAKHPDDLWEMKISSRRVPSRVNLTIKPSVLLGENSSAILTAFAATDPYWANVVSLLHFDGNLTDEADLNRTWGGSYVAAVGSGLDGSTALDKSARISVPDSGNDQPTPWVFYAEPCTLEFFLKRDSSSDTGNIISLWPSNIRFKCEILSSNLVFTAFIGGIRTMSFALPFIDSDLEHIAIVRGEDGIFSAFRRGVKLSETYGPYSGAVYSGTGGSVTAGGVTFDELRITKGVARYTSNFTPPTLPFPNI